MKDKKQKSKGNINYPVGDFLVRLKNACMAKHKSVSTDATKLIKAVAEVLKKEGYLDSVEEKDGKVNVVLTYRKKEPVMLDVKLVSKPGLRIYMTKEDVERKKGPTTLILSTSRGLMSSKEAIKKSIGGEAIAEIL